MSSAAPTSATAPRSMPCSLPTDRLRRDPPRRGIPRRPFDSRTRATSSRPTSTVPTPCSRPRAPSGPTLDATSARPRSASITCRPTKCSARSATRASSSSPAPISRIRPTPPPRRPPDHLVRAWHHTYGLPTVLTNCSNNYGPCQFPEKLIPLMIHNAVSNKPLPIYGKGDNVRDWLYVDDHARALQLVFERGTRPEKPITSAATMRKPISTSSIPCAHCSMKCKPRTDGQALP
jgi:hypothetical protein